MELSAVAAVGRGPVEAINWFYRVFSTHAKPARRRTMRVAEAFAAHVMPSSKIADLAHPNPRLSAVKLGDAGKLKIAGCRDALGGDEACWCIGQTA